MAYQSPFAPAQIDFSGIGNLYDTYANARNDRLKQDAFQEERAVQQAERDRQNKVRQTISQGIPTGPDGQPDYGAMAQRFAQLGDAEGARTWLSTGAQERERAANRAHQDRTFAADQEYKRAQIEKMKREAAETGTTYGKTGSIFQGADGKFYSIQFGGDGSRVILPVEVPGNGTGTAEPSPSASSLPSPAPTEGASRFASPGMATATQPPMPLTPSRGVDVVGNQLIDKATGAPLRDVGPNLAEAERQKVAGKAQGEGEAGLPKAATALRDYEIKNGLVMDEIDRALKQASPWTTGFVGNVGSFVAGTPAHDLSKMLDGIQSNLGFDTLQQMRDNSPTGGALGSITERELALLQATWGSLVQSQSEDQFRYNLNRLKQIKQQYAVLKREAYERDVARFGAGRVPNPDAAPGPANRTFNWTPDGGLQEAQ